MEEEREGFKIMEIIDYTTTDRVFLTPQTLTIHFQIKISDLFIMGNVS